MLLERPEQDAIKWSAHFVLQRKKEMGERDGWRPQTVLSVDIVEVKSSSGF